MVVSLHLSCSAGREIHPGFRASATSSKEVCVDECTYDDVIENISDLSM